MGSFHINNSFLLLNWVRRRLNMQGRLLRLRLGLFLLHMKGVLNRDWIRLLSFNLDGVLLLDWLWLLCLNIYSVLNLLWVRLSQVNAHNFISWRRIVHRFINKLINLLRILRFKINL